MLLGEQSKGAAVEQLDDTAAGRAGKGCCRGNKAEGAAEGAVEGCCRGAVERCCRGSSRRMLLSFASEAIIIFL